MQKKIEYLRIVLTGQCNLNCSYCHNEGMEKINNSIIEIDKIVMITTALYKCGIRKFKLMGGEPTLYKKLPELINELKKIGNDIDISMITNGLFEKELIAKSISSGLGRVNVSVHSWGNEETMKMVGMDENMLLKLQENLKYLKEKNVLSKVNYVYIKNQNKSELIDLINWVDNNKTVIDILNILSELGIEDDKYCSFDEIEQFIYTNFNVTRVYNKENVYSLPSKRLVLSKGGEVNLKITTLNSSAGFDSCKDCNAYDYCLEGIKAIRLTSNGEIQPCIYRTDNICSIHDWTDLKKMERTIREYIKKL